MEEVSLTETESRYFADLFLCCDVEKTGKIPTLKATELYRSANLSNDVVQEITSLSGIPQTALHISRSQFYSCLKLIAAYQASIPLRQELIAASVNLPLPRFSWKESPPSSARIVPGDASVISSSSSKNSIHQTNGMSSGERKDSLSRRHVVDWRETRSPDLIQLAAGAAGATIVSSVGSAGSRRNLSTQQQQQSDAAGNSDVLSTDSEVEQNESSGGGTGACGVGSGNRDPRRHRGAGDGGSPEAWSTNSDSPTPTNSVAERQWVKDTLWHGLLGDEHRQLLGTEEESSDRHSSDDDNESDLETVYQITPEQREYYFKQFKAVQHDPHGLVSGHIARVFFEKSRIPVEELRHIWQLCDVTRDGALSLAEFTAAMHLVVLRRNNISLPAVLPACLHPSILKHSTLPLSTMQQQQQPTEPPEADLLHLNDDDGEDNTDSTVIGSAAVSTTLRGSGIPLGAPPAAVNEKNAMNISTLSSSSQVSTSGKQPIVGSHVTLSPPPSPPPVKNRSITNSPNTEPNSPPPTLPAMQAKDLNFWDLLSLHWTKFVKSPTSNVSSPGPKPVNFDMQRTAQAVVSDPQILHPVPLRVTPVGTLDIAVPDDCRKSENHLSFDRDTTDSPKQHGSIVHPLPQPNASAAVAAVAVGVGLNTNSSSSSSSSSAAVALTSTNHRDSLQNNDLRAIQRPQAKKLPTNIGALPPPPQRESSIGGGSSGLGLEADIGGSCAPQSLPSATQMNISINGNQNNLAAVNKKDPPPLPPPRPHRHGRSSSLDLKKFKMIAPNGGPQPEMTAQASFDLQTTGFADFAHFPDGNKPNESTNTGLQQVAVHTASAAPPSRFSLQSNQRVSAFEVYRKPNTPRNSQSPEPTSLPAIPVVPPVVGVALSSVAPPITTTAAAAVVSNTEMYEKRVNAISETLRHVSFKKDSNIADILRHLREQNTLLLRLCNDLSDELLAVMQRKEEIRVKLDVSAVNVAANGPAPAQPLLPPTTAPRTGSSISAPMTANITGGSGSSGVHSNV